MNSLTQRQQTLITFTVMIVAIIEVLDMTIVNVALPPMMGSLGANSETITWVLTSYIVASAVCMPLTGFLIDRLGQKHLLIVNILGFMCSSALCGVADNLVQMIIFRTLQGVFGASLVPLSQFILRQTYSSKDYGKAMAFWGVGIMAAPVLGPTLGGYITEQLNWRWIFYINIPICLWALFLTVKHIPETKKQLRKTDTLGLILMVIAIGALQLFLDQGNQKDWFDSTLIQGLFISFLFGGYIFIKRGWQMDNHIIRLHLFKDTTFCLSSLMVALYTCALLGILALQPMMLERLMGYSAQDTGLLMAPRGFASALMMGLSVQLMKKIPIKHLLLCGILLTFYGTYLMVGFKLTTPANTIMWVGAIQGLGMGLFFVPISTIAFDDLAKSEVGEASGLFSFSRSLGSSIGISLLSTTLSRQLQIHWNQLGEQLTPYDPIVRQWLQTHTARFGEQQALLMLKQKLLAQSSMNAFSHSFMIACWCFLALLPLVYFLKHSPKQTGSAHST